MSRIAYLFAEANRSVYRSGGDSTHVRAISRALKENGHEVCILAASRGETYDPTGPPVHELAPRVTAALTRRSRQCDVVYHQEHSSPTAADEAKQTKISLTPAAVARDIARAAWWQIWNAYFYWRARQVIMHERPDFLYERYVCGTSVGAKLAQEFRLPLIIEMNTSYTFPSEWWAAHSAIAPWIFQRLERRLGEAADRIVAISTYLRDYLISTGVTKDKIVVMYNAADVDRFRPQPNEASRVRSDYGFDGQLVIGFAGSLKQWHGVDVLIRSLKISLKEIPSLRLLIVGDGPLRHSLEALARDEGVADAVVFTGSVAYDAVPAYISAMDIAVSPAPRFPKLHASPIKVFEYMAAARPVVAADYSDISAVVEDHSNGLLVRPGDENQLAQAILELASHSELRARLGQAARVTLEEGYTWRRNAERILALFEEVKQRNALRYPTEK